MLNGKVEEVRPGPLRAPGQGSTCAQCGGSNEEGAAFCGSCGSFLEWEGTSATAPVTTKPAPEPDPPAPPAPVAIPEPPAAVPEHEVSGRTVALSIVVSPGQLAVDPGGEGRCEIRVRNAGSIVDRVVLSVVGPGSWASADPEALNIYPGETASAQLTFRPPRTPETRAGVTTFEVIATSKEDPAVTDRAEVAVDVAPFSILTGHLHPPKLQGRRAALQQVTVENLGNAPVSVHLEAEDPGEALSLRILGAGQHRSLWSRFVTWALGRHRDAAPAVLALDPGQSGTAQLVAVARGWNLSSPPLDNPFQVSGTAAGSPDVALPGGMTQLALVPKVVPRILMALVPLLAMLIAFLLLTTTVPNVVGRPVDAAVARLQKSSFVVTRQSEDSDTVAPGQVIRTDPNAGSLRKTHTGVTVWISAGPKLVSIPGLANLDVATAKLQLGQAGLVVNEVSEPNDTVPAGTVIGTDPPANTPVKRGSAVQLHISTGPPPVPIPVVAGLGPVAATAKLRAAGFAVTPLTEASSVRSGNVTRTDPAGGSSAQKGSIVNMYVSTGPGAGNGGGGGGGPGTITVPSVAGQDQATALGKVSAAGFQVATATEPNPAGPGTVIRTNPAGGTQAAKGSTVTLVISAGPPPPGGGGPSGIPVPGVAGSDLNTAASKLAAAGFPATVAWEANGSLPKGQVTRTDPPAGSSAAKGSSVTLYLSLGKIAFRSTRDGHNQIYTMNADGSGQARPTPSGANDSSPAMSPDGRRVAFSSDRDGNSEIYVVNTDGSGLARLTTNPAIDDYPTWSPDGQRIAFVSYRDGNSQIYVMNANGTGQVRISNNSFDDSHPSWSPDGQTIAFVTTRDGNSEIYTMATNGLSQARVTHNPAVDSLPAWSPDSKRIAFVNDRDGNNEIYVRNADGSETRITNSASVDTTPGWWPDGQHIVIASDRGGAYGIYEVNLDGSGAVNLSTAGRPGWTGGPVNDFTPSW